MGKKPTGYYKKKKKTVTWWFACSFCGKVYNQRWLWKRHLKSHTTDHPHVCDQCDYKSQAKWMLERHWKSHLRPNYRRKVKDDKEKIAVSSDVEGSIHDQTSDVEGSIHDQTSDVEGSIHDQNKPSLQFQCNLCFRSLKSNIALQRHFRFHQPKSAKKYACPVCNFNCFERWQLHRHMKTKCSRSHPSTSLDASSSSSESIEQEDLKSSSSLNCQKKDFEGHRDGKSIPKCEDQKPEVELSHSRALEEYLRFSLEPDGSPYFGFNQHFPMALNQDAAWTSMQTSISTQSADSFHISSKESSQNTFPATDRKPCLAVNEIVAMDKHQTPLPYPLQYLPSVSSNHPNSLLNPASYSSSVSSNQPNALLNPCLYSSLESLYESSLLQLNENCSMETSHGVTLKKDSSLRLSLGPPIPLPHSTSADVTENPSLGLDFNSSWELAYNSMVEPDESYLLETNQTSISERHQHHDPLDPYQSYLKGSDQSYEMEYDQKASYLSNRNVVLSSRQKKLSESDVTLLSKPSSCPTQKVKASMLNTEPVRSNKSEKVKVNALAHVNDPFLGHLVTEIEMGSRCQVTGRRKTVRRICRNNSDRTVKTLESLQKSNGSKKYRSGIWRYCYCSTSGDFKYDLQQRLFHTKTHSTQVSISNNES